MLWRIIEPEVVPTCRELGLGQIVWSPMAQGVLSGKYRPGQPPPAGSRATDEKGGANFVKRFMTDDVLTRVQQLRPIAEELELTTAQLAIAWVLQNDNVAAALDRNPILVTALNPIIGYEKAAAIAKRLQEPQEEATIVAELNAVQGKPVDIGGYYHPDVAKAAAAMRPSATLNAALDSLGHA